MAFLSQQEKTFLASRGITVEKKGFAFYNSSKQFDALYPYNTKKRQDFIHFSRITGIKLSLKNEVILFNDSKVLFSHYCGTSEEDTKNAELLYDLIVAVFDDYTGGMFD